MAISRLILSAVLAAPLLCAAQPPMPVNELHRPNVVVVLRHATAPGVGDPPGFRLDDCATQRNLDAAGRKQAATLGTTWRASGFRPVRVMSSAWCRCQETARLLDLGPVTVQPLLNSFFGADANARTSQTERLSRLIDALDPRGGPYLMVTHQVVITALSGHGAESAGGVAIELPSDGLPKRVRVLPSPPAPLPQAGEGSKPTGFQTAESRPPLPLAGEGWGEGKHRAFSQVLTRLADR